MIYIRLCKGGDCLTIEGGRTELVLRDAGMSRRSGGRAGDQRGPAGSTRPTASGLGR